MRDRIKNPIVQQYILELLLPIIGYYFLDWSLVMIALFYLIDQFAAFISFCRKLRSISVFNGITSNLTIGLYSFVFFIAIGLEMSLLYHFFTTRQGLEMLENECWTFLKQELWLLLPLVMLVYYIKDQFTFFMPRKYTQLKADPIKRHYLISIVSVPILLIPAVMLLSQIADEILIWLFLIAKLGFDFTLNFFFKNKLA